MGDGSSFPQNMFCCLLTPLLGHYELQAELELNYGQIVAEPSASFHVLNYLTCKIDPHAIIFGQGVFTEKRAATSICIEVAKKSEIRPRPVMYITYTEENFFGLLF